ncbi:hypothetical protein ACFL21_01095 [Patescibacteria group bacterium]
MSDLEGKKTGAGQDSPQETSSRGEEGEATQNGGIKKGIGPVGSNDTHEAAMTILEPLKVPKNPEVPTKDEVFEIMKVLVEGREYRVVRERSDEKGLYLWDIIISGEDGEESEYSYARKGRYPETKSTITVINSTFFDSDGFPVGGGSEAKLIDGKWKMTP